VAQCDCGCMPIQITDNDLVVFELAEARLGEEIRRACGFERIHRKLHPLRKRGQPLVIGKVGPRQYPVVLCCRAGGDTLAEIIDERFLHRNEACLLVTPTAWWFTDILKLKCRRLGCELMALSETVAVYPGGKLRCTGDIKGLLDRIGQNGEANEMGAPLEAIPHAQALGAAQIHVGTRLRFLPGFNDIWFDDVAYDLRERKQARLCLQYLVECKAFDASSARHFRNEIDPHVRAKGNYPRSADPKIDHYFNEADGRLANLRKALIQKSGRRDGRYFLKVK
jgi:hypothetical protein